MLWRATVRRGFETARRAVLHAFGLLTFQLDASPGMG
jgi:hypothetical protein